MTTQADLLVLTDAGGGRAALALAFRNATVIELDGTGPPDVAGSYDTVVIDLDALEAVGGGLAAALRPGGRVLIALRPGRQDAPTLPDGLAWAGLALLDGWPCAVLRAGDPGAADAAQLLATAEAAVRLAAGGPGPTIEQLKTAMAEHVDDRQRSEDALLLHLETLARELDRERRRHRGTALVRTILGRSAIGRVARRLRRRARVRAWFRPPASRNIR